MKRAFKIILSVSIIAITLMLLASCKCYSPVKRYNVHFMVDGVEHARVYSDGRSMEMPTDPEKEGYTFVGWYYDNATFEDKFDIADISSRFKKVDVYLYAKFDKITIPEEPETPTEPEEGEGDEEEDGPGSIVVPPSQGDVEQDGWT